MSIGKLRLLFNDGMFLLALLTFIVIFIKNNKKIVALDRN
ncbi:putative holin-like toxin [Clostridium sardiniense]|uniref:Holin-like toxin n=1 Tax=Clostridium sardiniense TaxID=29369 RepID=A0ABS7KTP9_CLOSR|nr:putative holin-like toxin [Clostridium sardiniense]MBY0754195.1 putative holin-like toxin [Clostridium sardiniense]MDQ0462220.1 hypothetical protein [Clostridium sardiniense]